MLPLPVSLHQPVSSLSQLLGPIRKTALSSRLAWITSRREMPAGAVHSSTYSPASYPLMK